MPSKFIIFLWFRKRQKGEEKKGDFPEKKPFFFGRRAFE
jgi:hypothetical protein